MPLAQIKYSIRPKGRSAITKEVTTPRRSRTKSREEREADIIHAGFAVFTEQGFAAAKMDDIAHAAGVSKGTVYLYFKTKEEVFKGVVRSYVLSAFERMAQGINIGNKSHEERLKFIIKSSYELLSGDASKIMLMLIGEGGRFPELIDFYFEIVLKRAQGVLSAVIREGIDAGEFRDVPVDQFPQAVMGPCMMGVIWKHHFSRHRPIDLDQLYEVHLDLLLHGLSNERNT